MKKLLNILTAIVCSTTTCVNVVACGACGNNNIPNKPMQQIVDLSKVITDTNLGNILTQDTLDENIVKDMLQIKIPNLKTNKISIENIGITTAKITSCDTKIYTGEVDISYHNCVMKEKKEISSMASPIDFFTFYNLKWYVGLDNGKVYSFDEDFNNKDEVVSKLGNIQDIEFHNSKWYVASNNGKIYSFDENFNNKAVVASKLGNIRDIEFHNSKWYVAAQDGKIYRFDEDFSNKTDINTDIIGKIQELDFINSKWYVAAQDGKIYRFDEDFSNKTVVLSNIYTYSFVYNNHKWYVTSNNGKIYSFDENFSVESKMLFADKILPKSEKVYEIFFKGNNLYLGSSKGNILIFEI